MKETNNQDSDFLKEKLKRRPLNRRKLLRRMLLTILMAVLFGTVASATIILLEPIISEYLYPEYEEPELIIFPEDIIEEEILPEDMITDEKEMIEIQQAQEIENNPPPEIIDDDHIRKIAGEVVGQNVIGINDYLSINAARLEIYREVRKSLVTVTGLTADALFNNIIENRNQTTGVIVYETTREIMILANIVSVRNSDTIQLTFINSMHYPAAIKSYDKETGLAILSIPKTDLDDATRNAIKTIELGSSSISLIMGIPIIAVGRIISGADSVFYGNITSAGGRYDLVDAAYRILTTDIYGSTIASGFIVNLRGQLIGIVDNSNNTADARNIVNAIGITELKKLIEVMGMGRPKPYIGIIGSDVPNDAHEAGVPKGAFISEVLIDSPAMHGGLQSGDIIIRIEAFDIISFTNYVNVLFTYRPEQTLSVTVMRQGPDGYREVETEIVTA